MLLDLKMEKKACRFSQFVFIILMNLAQGRKDDSVMYNAEQKVRNDISGFDHYVS